MNQGREGKLYTQIEQAENTKVGLRSENLELRKKLAEEQQNLKEALKDKATLRENMEAQQRDTQILREQHDKDQENITKLAKALQDYKTEQRTKDEVKYRHQCSLTRLGTRDLAKGCR